MRDTGDARRGLCLVSETRRDAGDEGDVRRMAHNPQVGGSNPQPSELVTRVRSPPEHSQRCSRAGRPRSQTVKSASRLSRQPARWSGLTARMSAGPPVPGSKTACFAREVGKVSGRVPLINGVAVVSASAEIDVTTAEQLQMALLEADRHGHATVVVDMTRTRFCDSAGLHVLAEAHRRALAEGGGLRLVIPIGGAVARLLFLTGLDCYIPSFGSLKGAVAAGYLRLSHRVRLPSHAPSMAKASPWCWRGAVYISGVRAPSYEVITTTGHAALCRQSRVTGPMGGHTSLADRPG